ncbi:PPOX class F420-dependent oxidoreductase [Pseudonocardia sp. GCM10023141]|uniref:PPOX class F420-dependent oxidoreductase n=1 Tax=Pseudonocardia sp. GCM10023141 TaxID=3252653 RepID=UPI003611D48A
MSDVDPVLLDLFTASRNGTLITLKRDGRPQASVVTHHFDVASRTLRVSITEGRAKTRNLRRDPRASYSVVSTDQRTYAVGEALAELTPPATAPDDATADALVELYRSIAGEHPDWDEYRAAMVADHRVVLTLKLDRIYGANLG